MSSRNHLSIDIGAQGIKIMLGKYSKKKIKLQKACIIRTPEGSYDDGQLTDIESIGRAIKEGLSTHRIKNRQVIFTLETSLAIIREITIPQVKKDELATMVQYEIEQFLIIDFQKYDIQYKIIEELVDNEIKKLRLLIVALPKTIVVSYLELMKLLKLKPVALDIHPNAITKYCNTGHEHYSTEETVAVIDIGYKTTNVIIIKNGYYGFNRMIKMGGEDMLEHIASNYNISMDEAAEQLKTHGNLEIVEDKLVHSTILNELVMNQVNNIISELNKIFRFYNSRKPGNRIHKIVIHGGMASIDSLDKYIHQSTNIPVYSLGQATHIKKHKRIQKLDLSRYHTCMGALIRK